MSKNYKLDKDYTIDMANMSPKNYIDMIRKRDAEIHRLSKELDNAIENLKLVSRENKSLKAQINKLHNVINVAAGEFSKNFEFTLD